MEEYISIVVPYFNRINYLKELIESVYKYADMPFELIVHDDASVDGSTPEVFNMRDKISTLIFNTGGGHNIGLPQSVNRLVSTATSNHIIFLNDDCEFVSKSLRNIYNIISRPYIGYLHLTEALEPNLNSEEGKFKLMGVRSGSALAFRKDVWKRIRGWSDFHSGVSDVAFMVNTFRNGYFAASIYGKECVINVSRERAGNKDSSMAMSGYDCCYPKIFNLEGDYNRYCKIREEEVNRTANSQNNTKAGLSNLSYWCDYMNKLLFTYSGSNPMDRIDWNVASIHGQNKWKEEIEKDKMLV